MLVVSVACSTFDPNAPYTLIGGRVEETTPIPEGTSIIEHPPVPIEGRDARIDLVEDLVLERGEEPFYRIDVVDADIDGNIIVHDSGNQNIAIFDVDGNYLRTIGRPGQGPGELVRGGDVAVGEDVAWVSNNRINIWSVDGELKASRTVAFTRQLNDIRGADSGSFVALARTRTAEGFRRDVVGIDPDGYRTFIYADLPRSGNLMVAQGDRATSTLLPRPNPTFALARSGVVYVTSGAEYEVLSLTSDNSPRWALRVAWPRMPLTDARIDRAMAHLMGRDETDDIPSGLTNVQRSDVDWPEQLPALIGTFSGLGGAGRPIHVDGHGHLYVFPLVPETWDLPDQPVDVYSADGEHLFSGLIPIVEWDSARGDHIYGDRLDPQTDDPVAVRYRLIEPFEG